MKKSILPLMSLLFLAACNTTPPSVEGSASSPASQLAHSSSSSAQPKQIDLYPLTVDHFRTMTLSGTNLVIGSVLERASTYTRYYLTYTSNGVKISGTIAIPNAEGAHKLIVLNHGYIDPAVYTNGRGLRREQAALARAGFAVLHTDYRKHAESDPDPDTRNIYDNALAYALDSTNAVLAVRELNDPRIDASKVGMVGHSMGGGVTQHILVAHPEVIDAAVLYAPISAVAWLNFERWRLDQRPESTPTMDAFGLPEENPAAWDALSQTGSLHVIEDPIMIFHGTNDKDVPIEWSDDLNTTLTALGKDIEYVVYPGEGHEFGVRWQNFADGMITFFKENI